MTFFISAPIFVFREFMRHRVGWSYNEESGRYRELQPVFYVPGRRPQARPGGPPRQVRLRRGHPGAAGADRPRHGGLLPSRRTRRTRRCSPRASPARSPARSCPVGLFSSMYATCNARSLMHFLGLRTQHELATVPSFPQREIEMVGEKMEAALGPAHAAHVRRLQRERPRRPVTAADSGRYRCTGQPTKCPYCDVSRSSSRLIKRTRHCLNPRAGSAGLRMSRRRHVPRGDTAR